MSWGFGNYRSTLLIEVCHAPAGLRNGNQQSWLLAGRAADLHVLPGAVSTGSAAAPAVAAPAFLPQAQAQPLQQASTESATMTCCASISSAGAFVSATIYLHGTSYVCKRQQHISQANALRLSSCRVSALSALKGCTIAILIGSQNGCFETSNMQGWVVICPVGSARSQR